MDKEQFAEWKSNPSTVEILEEITVLRNALQERLASGQTLCSTADETHGNTARMVGNIEGLDQLLNITFSEEEPDERADE